MKRSVFTLAVGLVYASFALSQAQQPLLSTVQAQKAPYLKTLESLVSIESGSRDREGLNKISALVHARLKALGAQVEFIEPGERIYKMYDTPERPGRMVKAVFKGNGSKKILLIAHMDTVYLKGMLAKQPFRVEGDRA